MNKVIGTLNRSRGALGNWCVSFGDNTEHGEVGGRDLSTFSFPFFFSFSFFVVYYLLRLLLTTTFQCAPMIGLVLAFGTAFFIMYLYGDDFC